MLTSPLQTIFHSITDVSHPPARDPHLVVEPHIPAMRITPRDARIMEALHAFDGVLSDEQIKRLFFTGTTQMQLRMRLLFRHGYVARPDRRQRASIPHMVYWLTEHGAAYVAGLSGTPFKEFAYRGEPKWLQLTHDLAVNDVRITLMEACQASRELVLDEWIPQSVFWAHPDRVEFQFLDGKLGHRYIRPDGYAIVKNGSYVARLLLELDRATEHNPRFGIEKVVPGIAYIRSDSYRRRFGFNSGKWLVVTTSDRRLQNMKRATELVAGSNARLFYFTTLDRVSPHTIVSAPIWHRGGEDSLVTLFQRE